MTTIDKIRAEIERRIKSCDATSKTPNQLLWAELSALLPFLDTLEEPVSDDLEEAAEKYAEDEMMAGLAERAFKAVAEWMKKQIPMPEDTVIFQKGVQEGRRLEREDALSIADIEKLHTFLYAVKNNKQGAFTFTRLSDEQYEEVLRRFNKTKEQ